MTPVHRPEKTAGLPLSRRQLGRLAAAGVATAAATGTGLLATAPPAAADEGDGEPHFAHARRLAGNDPVLRAIAAALTPGAEIPRPPAPAPLKIFDNLALLSVGWVSAMAVLTEDGIVLIDALTSPTEAAEVIVPGLRALGARPETIRYVVATHGHGDHIGGAQYLADRYGTRVLMTPADWDLVARTRPEHAPARDLDIVDGQRLVLGGTTVSLHHTPGHTAGTVSPIIPVRAGRESHTAMLWGGANPPATLAELRTYLASLHTFRRRMHRAGVDVELSNHPNDHGLQRAEQLRDDPGGPNPFVLGRPRTQRYMAVMESMLRGWVANAS
ncbi:MBL fold metallo-hydrolase [Streptomyces sp. NPDC059788]|uniref:MBL fold metallo-hydrolase n=1 Tax=Streptomyces sp. NPDC059788 TaxID=3346948 RepID=UPI003667CA99